jgi:hypothetical protein
MKPVSLADISYEQGLKLLTLRKQAMDAGHIRRMTPEALANALPLANIGRSFAEKAAEGGLLDSLKSGIEGAGRGITTQWNNLDQASRNALLSGAAGTGLGALAGLGSAYTSGEGNYLSRALRGGLAGGAVGGGLGLALNPSIASKLYSQGKSILKSKAPETSKQIEGESPAEGLKTKTTAQKVMDATPADRGEAINDLQSTATSSSPELVAAPLAAGTIGGTAYGLKKLHDIKGFDTNALAEHIHNRAFDKVNKSPALSPTALGKLLGSRPENATQLGVDAILEMRAGNETPKTIASMLEEGGKVKPTLFGNVPEHAKNNLAGLVRNDEKALKALTEASNTKGFFNSAGKARKGRIGAALALLGLGGGALQKVIGQYRQNTGERTDAQKALRDLSSATQSD